MTPNTRRPEAHFRPDDTMLDKLNWAAERWRGVLMILVPLASIIAAIVSAMLFLKTDIGYTQTAPGQRIQRLEARVDTLRDLVVGQNRVIRALGADWCFRANDTVRAISDVSCFDLTRGIRR